MKHYLTVIALLVLLLPVTLTAQTPAFRWAQSAGGVNDDEARIIALDSSGNSYVTGYFYNSTITFGTTTLTNAGGYDMFVVKYDASGNVVWAKSAGGTGYDQGWGIAVDASGNSYVTGSFSSSSITFGTTTLTNVGGYDVFVVKYNTSGNVVWAISAGGTSNEQGNSIAVDASRNSYVTGYFSSPTITFGTTTLTNAGSYNVFVVKYNANGNVVWAKGGSATNLNAGNCITVDASGHSYVTGYFDGTTITFGTTTLTNTGSGTADIFVVKYDASGNVVWAKSAGSTGQDFGQSIAIDAFGNNYVWGYFNSPTITFGTTALTNAGGYDVFVVKADSNGNVLWAKSAGGTVYEYSYGIAVDGSGNIYVLGYFNSPTITFGTTTLTNFGGYDIFVVKYNASGNVVWAKSAGGIGYDESWGIAVDASGNTFMTGYFDSPTITFGATTLQNGGSVDLFVVKLSIPPTITSITDVPNDQGGQVRIKWNRSSDDANTIPAGVTSYSVFRKSSSNGITIAKSSPALKNILMDSSLLGYDYVTTVPAFQLPMYQTIVSTLEDSTTSGTHYSDFLVVSQTSDITQYLVSAVDSGYSVDNLAPIQPSGFVATAQSGPQAQLTWNSPSDPDVGHYDVYRSTGSGFTPAPGLRIGTSYSTGFTDGTPSVGMAYHYRIIAVDVHGNQSKPSSEATAAFPVTQTFAVNTSWNMISVPLVPNDYTKTVLYPTAISEAFAFQGSYVVSPILQHGVGYWLRFSGNQAIPITGTLNLNDTIDVIAGWNMIGSISSSVPVTSVGSVPGGLITSQFFGYNGGYTKVTSIEPGGGYWVKVNGTGKLILSSTTSISSRIIIRPISEQPPPPPDGKNGLLPKEFSLQQNYPNPFNPTTVITYTVPTSVHVRLSIYNMLGQEVATLMNETQDAGYKSVTFDANSLPSGVYTYRLTAGTFTQTKKMLFLK